jgi:hypothetical protein
MRAPTIHGIALTLTLCLLSCTARADADECFACHRTMSDNPSHLFQKDIHREKGITCAGCHGGNASTDDMAVAMDTASGFLGVPRGDVISRTCASCHSSEERMKHYGSSIALHQWENLEASVHGKLMNSTGNHLLQCTTCHGGHGIVRVKSPSSPVSPLNVVKKCSGCHSNAGFMRTYNPSLPVDQLEKYRTSVHGIRNAKGDVKAADCVSCHGSHSILRPTDVRSRVYPVNLPQTCAHCHSDAEYMKEYKIPTDQFEKFAASVHGVALLQRRDPGAPACNSCHGNHGASPPGVQSISNVCGTCHVINAELFAASPHKKAFDQRGLPECETCHGKHDIVAAPARLLGTSPGAVCSQCHTQQDNPKGFAVAQTMRLLVDSLEAVEAETAAMIEEAERKGMEVGASKFGLRDLRQTRMETRTVVHGFDEAKFRAVADKGLAAGRTLRVEAIEILKEFDFRRVGLGVSTLIITTLAVSLFLTIRKIEKRQREGKEAS